MWFWIGLVLGCRDKDTGQETGGPTDSGLASATIDWVPVLEDAPEGAFLSVWGADAEDVWIVGGQFDEGYILRGHDQSWTSQPLPEGTPLLNWVHGTAADDVWVAGLSGTILHWNGSDWTDHSIDTEAAFWGLYAQPSGEVVAVGGASRWGGESAMIWRYDGSTWSSIALPKPVDASENLFKVTFDGDQYWMVGAGGVALRGDGDSMEALATGYAGDLVTATVSDVADVVVVGGRGTGVIAQPSADGLSVTTQANAGLNGVCAYPNGLSVVVGERGYSALYDAETGELTEVLGITLDILHATWGMSGGKMYAVGGNLNTAEPYFHGVILVSDAPE